MANPNNDRNNELFSWLLPIILLFVFPPLGVLLLVLKLFGLTDRPRKRHPYDILRESGQMDAAVQAASARTAPAGKAPAARTAKKPAAKKSAAPKSLIPDGKACIIAGGILSGIFGLATLSALGDIVYWFGTSWFWETVLDSVIPTLCFLGAGLGVLFYGLRQRRKGRRFRKYLNLIGRQKQISLDAMSEVGGIPKKTLCDDLQEMLDKGILSQGYLDLMADQLVLSGEGVSERPAPQPAPKSAPAEEKPADTSREDAILAEIRQLNDDIAQPELSAKIDVIEDITRKIFQRLKEDPSKEPQLRSFLNYYLPTTLKILHAYAQLESQGIEGDNITAAKERIEGMMDKVVEGFQKQLDRLFEHDAMDITTDVKVLEQMLAKDGLSGEGMQMGL